MAWDLALQAVTVTISVVVGSFASYRFGLAHARREKGYEARFPRLEKFMLALSRLKEAVLAARKLAKARVSTGERLPEALVLIAEAAGAFLPVADATRMRDEILRQEKLNRRHRPLATGEAVSFVAAYRQRLLMAVGSAMQAHANALEEAGVGLMVVGSRLTESPEYSRVKAGLLALADDVARMLSAELGLPREETGEAHLPRAGATLEADLDALMDRARRELEGSLG